jgi:hypothetical protein
VPLCEAPGFMGIDVAKAPLARARRPSGERWAVPHDAGDIMTRVARVQALPPARMVLEATYAFTGS